MSVDFERIPNDRGCIFKSVEYTIIFLFTPVDPQNWTVIVGDSALALVAIRVRHFSCVVGNSTLITVCIPPFLNSALLGRPRIG